MNKLDRILQRLAAARGFELHYPEAPDPPIEPEGHPRPEPRRARPTTYKRGQR